MMRMYFLICNRLTTGQKLHESEAAAELTNFYSDPKQAVQALRTVESGTVFQLRDNDHDWVPEALLLVMDV